jgi:Putative papain-like cysteine peptidase (DUF1796)
LTGIKFVSLGGDCQPAVHVRKRCGDGAVSVFDWLGISAVSVIELIQNSFDGFFERENLQWEFRNENEWTVTDLRYKAIAHHTFKSQDAEHVGRCIQTFRYLGRLFMDHMRSEEPICYVRRWNGYDASDGFETDAMALHELILGINPNTVLLYLQLYAKRDPIIKGRFIDAYNPPTTDSNWQGDSDQYVRNFDLAEKVLLERSEAQ